MMCDWAVVESATAEGDRYSIHQCYHCAAEAVVVNGQVDLSQWECPGDIPTKTGDHHEVDYQPTAREM